MIKIDQGHDKYSAEKQIKLRQLSFLNFLISFLSSIHLLHHIWFKWEDNDKSSEYFKMKYEWVSRLYTKTSQKYELIEMNQYKWIKTPL